MDADLSPRERLVAEEYCRGFNDAEVADRLNMMVWTTRTHKKHIFSKWHINTTHEMVLLFIAKMKDKTIDIRALRDNGISVFLLLLIVIQMAFQETDYARTNNNTRTSRTSRTRTRRNEQDITLFG